MRVATVIGFAYFAVAGEEMLPQKTEAQKWVVLVVAWMVILLFALLLFSLARMARHRRRVGKEWKARQAQPSEEPPV